MLGTIDRIVEKIWGNENNMQVSYDVESYFKNGLILNDIDVIHYAFKHLKITDALNPKKAMQAYRYSFDIMCGALDEPKGNWKFDF